MREFFAGVGTLFRGFRWWGLRPDLMLLGLVPAVIVGLVLGTVLVLYLVFADPISRALTPFADTWPVGNAWLLRVALQAVLFLAILIPGVLAFTAVTLAVGDWFYERIWLAVEREADPDVVLADPSFWSGVRDSAALIGRATLLGIGTLLIGLIPVVGGVAAFVLGTWFAGRNLAIELVARPLTARGFDAAARRALVRSRGARATGFGVTAYLLLLVPFLAIVVMPAAVAGATDLARELTGERMGA